MPRPHGSLVPEEGGLLAGRALQRLLLITASLARLARCSGQAVSQLTAAASTDLNLASFAYRGCYVVPGVDGSQVERHNAVACNNLAVGQSRLLFALGNPPPGEAAGLPACLPLAELAGLASVSTAACQVEVDGGRRLGGDSHFAVYETRKAEPFFGLYRFVNLFGDLRSGEVNVHGVITDLGPLPIGWNMFYFTPSLPIGQPLEPGPSDSFRLAEWANVAAAGREFVHRPFRSNPNTYKVYSATEAIGTVTFKVDGLLAATEVVGFGALWSNSGAFAGSVVQIESTVDVVVATANEDGDYMQVLPAARTIYGHCSRDCSITVFGDTTGLDISLTRVCTNGTTVEVPPGEYEQDGDDYSGETCSWTAPEGYKISGLAIGDGGGEEATAFVPTAFFQLVTPLPAGMGFLLLVSDQPASCSWHPVGTLQLEGNESAPGVYHLRVEFVLEGTVITCDAPVTAFGDADCPKYFDFACQRKEMNLITLPMPTTTTTTTASTTATMSNITSTETATTVTTTATTTTNTTTTTVTTTNTTVTVTASTTTAINTTVTASTATVTTTENLGNPDATKTTTSDTITSTATTATATTITATSTTVAGATATATATTATTTTATATTITATATTVAGATATATATTATATTATATTIMGSTATTTTSTATTITETAATITATTVTRTTAAATSHTATVATATTATATTASSTVSASSAGTIVEKVEVMVETMEQRETSLMWDILGSNASILTEQVSGAFIVSAKVDASDLGKENSFTVAARGTDVEVTLPASLFTSLGMEGTCLMFTEFDRTEAAAMGKPADETTAGKDGDAPEVWAAVNVNLAWLNGSKLSVSGLNEPIKVTLPVHEGAGLQCAFWDKANKRWSTEGMGLSVGEGGLLVCETMHLTLFGAIWRGFKSTFTCSQATLLHADAIRELRSSDWLGSPGALCLWIVVGCLLTLMAAACGLDYNRRERWSDDHFLVVRDSRNNNNAQEEGDGEDEEEAEAGEQETSRGKKFCAFISASCCCAVTWCKTSGAVRDALDDVVSNWFDNFGEVRDFVEGLFDSAEIESTGAVHGGRVMTLVHRIMWSTLGATARREAASRVGISQDVAAFLMEDEHVADVLLTQFAANHGSAKSKETLHDLHTAIADEIDKSMERAHRWSSLPVTVWHLYLWQNPLGASLVHCVFMTSQVRVLLLMVEIFGSMALNTVFFQATGGLINKRVRSSECVSNDPLEQVGRIIAIGIGSILVAGLPAIILGSLCTREVKEFDSVGCPEWNRQLKVWRIQDRAIWTLGVLYSALCIFFMTVFLANVSQNDHKSWMMSALVSLAMDIIIIPLCIAFLIPLLATSCLTVMALHKQVQRRELVRERHIHIKNEGNLGNLTLPVVSV